MSGFESNVIHGDFLGSLGPILINLCKKNQAKVERDSFLVAQPHLSKTISFGRSQKADRICRALARCRIESIMWFS
jgi:hypothetical protein